MKKYRERLVDALTKYLDKNNKNLNQVKGFTDENQLQVLKEVLKDEINGFIIYATIKTNKNAQSRVVSSDELVSNNASRQVLIKNYLNQLNLTNSQLANLKTHQSQCRNLALELADIRQQETTAHIWEQVRFVLFRILTGIGIALIILGASYVAHEIMEIPLPGLRLIG